jgi:hypothetical protein
MPPAAIFTRTSPEPGSESGKLSIRRSFGAWMTTARMDVFSGFSFRSERGYIAASMPPST